MKQAFLIVTMCLITWSTFAQKNEKQAVLVFQSTEIDYGEIEQDANGEREFHFTNKGKAPLIISNVSSTCGCTVPSKPEEPILPGKTGVIKVKYDTHRVGPIMKTITVTSNASEPIMELKIKGTVKASAVPHEHNHDHAH